MRIAYFIPGPLSRGPLGLAELERREAFLVERAFPGTEVAVRETASGPASVESTVEEYLSVPGLIEAAPELEREGFDGFIIGCFGDPGLAAARELVRIPVIGPGQSSALLGAQLGHRFGILTVVDEVVPSIRRMIRGYGLEGLLADVRAVDVPVLELRGRADELLGTLEREGLRALEAGADTLILGCMTMGFLGVAAGLQERLDVPVVNPVLAALKAAETAVSAGVAPSRRAYPAPRKGEDAARRHGRLGTVARAALAMALGASAWGLTGSNPVSAQDSNGGAAASRANEPVDPALFSGLHYRMVGPTRGGRVTAVEGHPAHPATFYMGATGGGVWKTGNYGRSWRNISDGFFESPSIGSIEVADSDPQVVYVGTGSDGIRSNVIIGRGIYRSGDGGETWELMGLREAGQIGAVKAHPRNPDLVHAAALGNPFGRNEQRGVFRSENGGQDWEKVLFTSDSVGAIDLELHPTNPRIVYAAMWRAERKPWTIISGASDEDGIWKSTDGGDNWRRITDGLPDGLIGKIDFSVSAADPDRVYALVEAPEPLEGLYRSDDAGESWRLVNDDPNNQLMHRPFYFTNVTADPTDADVVYVNNLALWKSTDGGESFSRIGTPHSDNHDLWINPENPEIMVQGNDGGANVTLDGGRSWSTINNQPTAELYQVDLDDRFPYWLYAGQQDNSTIAVPSLPPAEPAPAGAEAWWKAIGGCETGPVVPKPGDPDIVYANCKGRFGRYNMRTGQEQQYYVGAVNLYGTNPKDLPYRFQRVVPIEVSPHDPDVVYHGSQYVHRTTDGGRTWERISPDLTAFRPERQVVSGTPITRDITGEEHYSTLYVIEASPHDPGVIWTGANDGPVHVTRDGGGSWTEVTPPMPPEGRVNAIEISPHRPGKVYVATYRYLLGDFRPYLYRTTDGGESWALLTDGTNGIPAEDPVRVVREDPDREGLLYAGTETGVYVSFNDGEAWQPFQLNLPVTPITDIAVHRKDLVLSTMGRSFWILDDLTPLHELTPQVASADVHLFEPRPTVRMRYGRPGGFGPTNPAAPEYPSPGARIDYWLADDAGREMTLEIFSSDGSLLRRFESAPDSLESRPEGDAPMAPFFGGGGPAARLSGEPGMHRFTWDLRADGSPSASGGPGRGPLAPPGKYRVRLTAGGFTREHELTVRMDPRVAAEGIMVEDLEEQFRFNGLAQGAVAEARSAAATADSLLALMEEVLEGETAAEGLPALKEQLEELRSALVTAGGSYPQPMLVDQLRYLSGMTARADQRPGQDAYARYEELRAELDRRITELEEIERLTSGLEGGGGR